MELPEPHEEEEIPEITEIDELQTFVGSKNNKVWIWTVVNHWQPGILLFQNGDFNIPLGLGSGKVINTDKIVYNLFLEPQYIVASEGDGQPEWQLFFGLNLQFKKSS